MDSATRALQWLADSLGPFVPRLIGALAIALGAWIAARLVRSAILRAGGRAGLDERLHNPGFSALLADIGHWVVWLLALPALLGSLELKGLLDPVNAMLSRLLGYLPNLVGAAVVLGVGILVAGIVRRIVVGMLTAAGSEKLAERLGLGAALGRNTLAGIAGTALFALLLLPTVAAALQALGLDAVTKPVSQLLDNVMSLIPRLVSAAIILALAALIGRALAGIVSGLMAGLGVNALPAQMGWRGEFNPGGRDLSELLGSAAMAVVMFVALAQASEVIGLPMLTDAVAGLGAALLRVAVALLVLGVGLWVGQLAAQMVRGSGVAHGRVLGNIARGAVLFFAGALALRQAGLPAEIVTIAFASVVGALAIGVAVALGVGGRHVAARLLDRAVAAFDGTATPSPPAAAPHRVPHDPPPAPRDAAPKND